MDPCSQSDNIGSLLKETVKWKRRTDCEECSDSKKDSFNSHIRSENEVSARERGTDKVGGPSHNESEDMDEDTADKEQVVEAFRAAKKKAESVNCPDCGGDVSSEHLRKDGAHPEIGYEYYECPDCGNYFTERHIQNY